MAHPPLLRAQHEGDAHSNSSSSTVDARGGSVSHGASGSADARDETPLAVRKPLAPRVHTVRSEYPLNVAVDFTQLRANALRRYMAYHRIQEVPGSSREQLAVAVARHFNEECQRADESATISSFVSYLTSSKDDQDADDRFPRDDDDSDKENSYRHSQLPIDVDSDADSDFDIDERARDGAYDYYPNEREEEEGHDENDDRLEDDEYDEPAYTPRKRKPSSSEGSSDAKSSSHGSKSSNGRSSSSSGNNNNNGNGSNGKKKKRKARVYCVCKGSSHGNMIACDNKKCLDRSNWYHMGCIGLDDAEDPPETWYCPMCQEQDPSEIPENQYRKPVASVTYGDMISHALSVLPQGKGTFKEICDFVEKQYESQLNWKLESDQRKSPVWKSSVRKILFSNMRFRKHPDDKGLFCLAPSA